MLENSTIKASLQRQLNVWRCVLCLLIASVVFVQAASQAHEHNDADIKERQECALCVYSQNANAVLACLLLVLTFLLLPRLREVDQFDIPFIAEYRIQNPRAPPTSLRQLVPSNTLNPVN